MMRNDEPNTTERERWRALRQIELALEAPMAILGLVWLVLLALDLTVGLSRFLRDVATLIWIAFLFDFALRFALAPRKLAYLARNWLTAVSLALPALRFLRTMRVLRLARVVRSVRLVRILGSFNRGFAALRRTSRRRGLGYVVLAGLLVMVVGAAGLYGLERGAVPSGGFDSYATALWWAARLVMTIGPEFWPQTPEGRILALLMALYGYATFGYVTAAFASFFVERDAASARGALAGQRELEGLRREIRALRDELARR